jgi:predicted glycosyltransferase
MILFDIVTPKWVLFFKEIIKKIGLKEVIVTTRYDENYTETKKLLELHKIPYISVGEYGGVTLEGKLKASIDRQIELIEIVKEYNIKKVISGSVVDINRVAFGLGIDVINFDDMPTKTYDNDYSKVVPMAKLTIPLSTILFKPFTIDDELFLHLGLTKQQIKTYNFIDPFLWIKDFKYDENYVKKIYKKYNINFNKQKIIVREEEYKSSYVDKKYPQVYNALKKINELFDVEIIIIPRYESEYLKKEFPFAKVIDEKIELQHLLKDADLFIGGGGTINSEACFLGTPTISTRSFISHYDKWQIDKKMMVLANNENDIIDWTKKALDKQFKVDLESLNEFDINLDFIIEEIIK